MDNAERQLLIDVSVLYYLEGKTQSEIAKELYLSRPKVSRLLKQARELDVVDIKINYQSDDMINLQNEIKRRFSLHSVVSVKTLVSYEDTLKEIGKAAAAELIQEIREGMTIGISWGKTVRNAVHYLPEKPIKDVKIVELFGAISYDMNETDMLSIGNVFSWKISGKFYPLPAPIFIGDHQAREALVNNPVIRNSLNMIENCDLILTGLGAVESDIPQKIWDVYVESDARTRIVNSGGVGFICAHFYDEHGRFLDIDINDNVIGIKTENIRNNRIFLAAGGRKKAKAILAALKGGYVSTLVSDEKTLQHVLDLANKKTV